MTDKEMLDLAADAAGIEIEYSPSGIENVGGSLRKFRVTSWHGPYLKGTKTDWNPLVDDGDALRLAVKLNMTVKTTDYGGAAKTEGEWLLVADTDTLAATRRAIVRAAAEIVKGMK